MDMNRRYKEIFLSKLLHYANRTQFNKNLVNFYDVKSYILKKYGIFDKYELQFVEGKKCYSCAGTGIYHNYYTGFSNMCYNCYSGWYKRPFYSILEVYKFGGYTFHKPKEKVYIKPENLEISINGYIQHSSPKYGFLAMLLILFIYDKKSMKNYFDIDVSNGWRVYWWKPENFILNMFHILKKREKCIPIMKLRLKIQNKIKNLKKRTYTNNEMEDLPF